MSHSSTFRAAAVMLLAATAAAPLAFAQESKQGSKTVATLQAQGAQVYECKTNDAGALVWQFREPIATLFENGKTVGRHYAGPHWELTDGSIVAAKVASS